MSYLEDILCLICVQKRHSVSNLKTRNTFLYTEKVILRHHKYMSCLALLTLKLLRDRSKFEIIFCFPLLSKLQNCWQMFWFAIHSHLLKENIHKFKIPRKNQHSIYFSHSNLKVGPFGPPPVA